MPSLSFHGPNRDGPGHHVARIVLPVAGVIAGTAAGFALAAVARRPGSIGSNPFALAPDGSTVEFDKGGIWVSCLPGPAERDVEPADDRTPGPPIEDAAGLAATGMRPTFEVEAELAREVDQEPALSAPRA